MNINKHIPIPKARGSAESKLAKEMFEVMESGDSILLEGLSHNSVMITLSRLHKSNSIKPFWRFKKEGDFYRAWKL